MSRNSLYEYDEECGLINIDASKSWIKVICNFISINLSVFFLLALYYKLVLYITNKDQIVDCNDGTLYLCGILVCPFIVLFTAVNEIISEFKLNLVC